MHNTLALMVFIVYVRVTTGSPYHAGNEMQHSIGIALAALALQGCAGLSTEVRDEEAAFQAVNFLDFGQTLNIAQNSNGQMFEHESAFLIGRHPSKRSVVAFSTGIAATHFAITEGLAALDAPVWVQRSWQVVTIGFTGEAVIANFSVGIAPNFGLASNSPSHFRN